MWLKWLFAVVVVLALILAYHAFPEIKTSWRFIQKNWLTIILAVAAVASALYAHDAYQRQKQLFVAQDKPLIDVKPLGIGQSESGTHAVTRFSLTNYSGFTAKNIGIDLKYDKTWIGEWVKADEEERPKGAAPGVLRKKFYLSVPPRIVPRLKPGETTKQDEQGNEILISGALKLEETVCSKSEDGIPVYVRVTWENKKRHVFDEVHKFILLCTKDDAGGKRAFTFIPKGVISKKD